MRNRSTIKLMVIFLIGLYLSCALLHKAQKKEDKLKKEIIKGVTTETVALNLLGSALEKNSSVVEPLSQDFK